MIFVAVKPRRALPIGPGKIKAVADAKASLLRRIDHEQAAKGPERLSAEVGGAFLFDDDDLGTGVGGFGRGHETGQTATYDDDIGGLCHGRLLAGSGPDRVAVLGCLPRRDADRRAGPRAGAVGVSRSEPLRIRRAGCV